MGKKPRKWLPIAEACEKLGRARRTLMTWRKQGCRGIKKRAGSLLVDCNQVEAWAHEQGKRPPAKAAAARARAARAAKAKAESGEQTAQPSNDSDSEDEVSLADAKLRKELALAKKHELHVAQAEGRLIPREEEEAGRLRRVEAARAVLLAMPPRYSGRLAAMTEPREIEELLTEAVYAALNQLAGRAPR